MALPLEEQPEEIQALYAAFTGPGTKDRELWDRVSNAFGRISERLKALGYNIGHIRPPHISLVEEAVTFLDALEPALDYVNKKLGSTAFKHECWKMLRHGLVKARKDWTTTHKVTYTKYYQWESANDKMKTQAFSRNFDPHEARMKSGEQMVLFAQQLDVAVQDGAAMFSRGRGRTSAQDENAA